MLDNKYIATRQDLKGPTRKETYKVSDTQTLENGGESVPRGFSGELH